MNEVAKKIPIRGIMLSILFVFVVLFGQTAYWLHSTIYSNEQFTAIATEAITSESSRQSIGNTVVERSLSDRPIVRQAVGPRLSQMIAALLGTDLAANTMEKVVERSHLIVTTPKREPVTFDTRALKRQIVALQSVVNSSPDERRIDTAQIPDEIILVNTANIPNIHSYSVFVLWVGVLSALAVVGVSGLYIYSASTTDRLRRIRQVLVLLVLSSVTALLVGPLVKPVFLSVAADAPMQTLLRNLFDGFIEPFNSTAIAVGIVAAGGLGLSIALPTMNTPARVDTQNVDKKPTKTSSTKARRPSKSKRTKS